MKSFFSDEVIDAIFRNLMGCLWMGNVLIVGDSDRSEVDDSTASSKEALDNVCELWKVERELLKKACTCKSLWIASTKAYAEKTFGVQGALAHRDAIAKSVYEEMFKFIVEKCSDTLKPVDLKEDDSDIWIGVLDIFGFEFVETEKINPFVDENGNATQAPAVNSFEQFCINLCNEQLQAEPDPDS